MTYKASNGKEIEVILTRKNNKNIYFRVNDDLKIHVIMEDERLTSVISNNVLIKADMSRNKRKKKVDGMAAVIILQGYLDRL